MPARARSAKRSQRQAREERKEETQVTGDVPVASAAAPGFDLDVFAVYSNEGFALAERSAAAALGLDVREFFDSQTNVARAQFAMECDVRDGTVHSVHSVFTRAARVTDPNGIPRYFADPDLFRQSWAIAGTYTPFLLTGYSWMLSMHPGVWPILAGYSSVVTYEVWVELMEIFPSTLAPLCYKIDGESLVLALAADKLPEGFEGPCFAGQLLDRIPLSVSLVGNTSNETFRCLLRRHIEMIRDGSYATVDETSVSEVVVTGSPGENRANTEPIDTVTSEPVITELCETESADALNQRKAHAELPRDGSSIHAAFAGYKGGITVEYVPTLQCESRPRGDERLDEVVYGCTSDAVRHPAFAGYRGGRCVQFADEDEIVPILHDAEESAEDDDLRSLPDSVDDVDDFGHFADGGWIDDLYDLSSPLVGCGDVAVMPSLYETSESVLISLAYRQPCHCGTFRHQCKDCELPNNPMATDPFSYGGCWRLLLPERYWFLFKGKPPFMQLSEVRSLVNQYGASVYPVRYKYGPNGYHIVREEHDEPGFSKPVMPMQFLEIASNIRIGHPELLTFEPDPGIMRPINKRAIVFLWAFAMFVVVFTVLVLNQAVKL